MYDRLGRRQVLRWLTELCVLPICHLMSVAVGSAHTWPHLFTIDQTRHRSFMMCHRHVFEQCLDWTRVVIFLHYQNIATYCIAAVSRSDMTLFKWCILHWVCFILYASAWPFHIMFQIQARRTWLYRTSWERPSVSLVNTYAVSVCRAVP